MGRPLSVLPLPTGDRSNLLNAKIPVYINIVHHISGMEDRGGHVFHTVVDPNLLVTVATDMELWLKPTV